MNDDACARERAAALMLEQITREMSPMIVRSTNDQRRRGEERGDDRDADGKPGERLGL